MDLAARGDPIVAVVTPPGRGAVGIVRLSGPALAPLAQALLAPQPLPAPRHARHGAWLDADGAAIDRGLTLWFPAPHSFTGEDVLELQAHGGPVVLQRLVDRALQVARDSGDASLARLRLAAPGEFTQRAFLNGKLDLAQAEGIADLIDATTEAAARGAAQSLVGAFSAAVEALARRLLAARVQVEAGRDFPEEELDLDHHAQRRRDVQALRAELAALRAQTRRGQLLREGLTVVLVGAPNVGKSSLLNALAGDELAIVTPLAGTTRDTVRASIAIDGVPLHVVDTAGLRADAEADTVERLGMARTWQAARDADALVRLHDLTRADDAAYVAAERDLDAQLQARLGARLPWRLHVFTKADAVDAPAERARRIAALAPDAATGVAPDDAALVVSSARGEGLDALRAALLRHAGWQPGAEGRFSARARHLQALDAAAHELDAAEGFAAQAGAADELLAEALRRAHDALGTITGRVDAEDLLGAIFSTFCIGK